MTLAPHMEETEPWRFTIVRSNGLRLMRPEKSWRPIVTVEVDKHHCHETTLGVDGQNPNLKEQLHFDQAHLGSNVDIRVWHRSQSKKKSKKRNLVASASHTLGEILKKQEKEPRSKVEIRLQCQSSTKKANISASKGKPQNGASLLLVVRPPPTFKRLYDTDETNEIVSYSSELELSSSRTSAAPSTAPHTPTSDTFPDTTIPIPDRLEPSTLRRRRRPKLRGFIICSDDELQEPEYESYSESEADEGKPLLGESLDCEDDDITCIDSSGYLQPIIVSGDDWIAPSLLPRYTERVEVPSELNFGERILGNFTMYKELKHAQRESDYEAVFMRLQREWTYIGGILVAMAALSTGVFSIAPGSIFVVHTYARNAIAASSISSGLGVATDAWFLLRYNWADLHTFIRRSRDIYGSHFFFALSSRVPALCLFIASVTLMLFLGLVAFEAWPMGVTVVSFAVGVVMGLQWLVWTVHAIGVGIGKGVTCVWRCARWVGVKIGVANAREEGKIASVTVKSVS